MINIIHFIKDLPRQWKAETPKIYRWIRNIAGTITIVLPVVYGSMSMIRITGFMPDWFNHCIGYVTFISGIITGVAGLKEKKPMPLQPNNMEDGRP